jgi:hypothetical protein
MLRLIDLSSITIYYSVAPSEPRKPRERIGIEIRVHASYVDTVGRYVSVYGMKYRSMCGMDTWLSIGMNARCQVVLNTPGANCKCASSLSTASYLPREIYPTF